MSDRSRGFSLVELSFVIVIILILSGLIAGGASFMTKEATMRRMVETGRDMLQGLKRYEAAMAQGGFPYPNPGHLNWSVLDTMLGRYMQSGSTSQAAPYDPSTSVVIQPYACAPGATCAGFASGSYPRTPGRVEYLYKNSATPHVNTFTVWDGAGLKTFRYYAVQVQGSEGYPVFTDGH